MYNYIPHPSNARLRGALLELRIDEGAAGYGIYWMLIELLRDADNYRTTSDARRLSFAINEGDVNQVQRIISNLALFDTDDDGFLYSPWLNEQMQAYDTKKAKLSAAGKRGAAARFGAKPSADGQAIATPSLEDGQAIAIKPNVILPNVTNEIKSTLSGGEVVDGAVIDYYLSIKQDGHAEAYVAQVCRDYGVSVTAFRRILEVTDNANTSNAVYGSFCALVKRIQRDKWTPDRPDDFFLRKIGF